MIQGTKITFNSNKKELLNDFKKVLDTGQITNSTYCRKSEKLWKKLYGFKEVHACSSGTTALELALVGLDIFNEGVLIPSLAPPMVRWAVEKSVNFVEIFDVNKNTFMLDLKTVKDACTNSHISAVIVIHIGGFVCPEIKEIAKFCKEKSITLIEDCSHAHFSKLNNTLAGKFGDVATFSFFATKPLTCGEGGFVCFNKTPLIEMPTYINQGRNKYGEYKYNSYHYRLSEFQAVVLYNEIKNISNNRRQDIANYYDKYIDNKNIIYKLANQKNSYYKYILKLPIKIVNNFNKNDIHLPSQVWPKKELFELDLKYFPNTEYIINNHICLPMHNDLTSNELDKTINVVNKIARV